MEFDFSQEPGKCLVEKYNVEDSTPLVSIITPFYNGGKYFRQTYCSVINQSFPYFEWIIIDDGTTEESSLNVLDKLCMQDSRIRVFHQSNKGQASARNFGIEKSRTEIVVPLDADDLLEPTYLEKVYFALYFNPDASWAYTDSVGFGEQQYTWSPLFSSSRMKRENILVCTAAIRKKALMEVDRYSEVAKHYNEDWQLWLKLLAKFHYPVHIKEIAFWYRRSNRGSLARLEKNGFLKNSDEKIIRECAQSVPNGIKAIEPRMQCKNEFTARAHIEWNRKLSYKKEKIRLLMLIPHMEMGGADLFNLDLVTGLNKDLFEIGIITTVPAKSVWRQRFKEHIVDLFELPNFLSIENWSDFILYYIKSRRVDIVFISNSYYGYYMVPLLRMQFPNVAIVDYVHMEEWYWRSGGYARTSMAVSDIIEKTYVCNEHLRKVMIEEFQRQPEVVKTVYIGVDDEAYKADGTRKNFIKENFHIQSNRKIVLFPCRMHPQKRPFLMLEIAKAVKARIHDICFLVAGDGPQFDEVKRKAQKEGLAANIIFLGRYDDMKDLYAASDLTLICSLKEGLALTAYESMAMSVPVITSNVGGQGELVNSEAGRVLPLLQDEEKDLDNRDFSKEEISQYFTAIVDLLENKERYKKCSLNSRRIIESNFSKKIMLNCMEREFLELRNHDDFIKRNKMAEILLTVPNFVDDYLNLYVEYESRHHLQNQVYKIYQNLKRVMFFKESPIMFFKNIIENRDNVYIKKLLKNERIYKLLNLFRKL